MLIPSCILMQVLSTILEGIKDDPLKVLNLIMALALWLGKYYGDFEESEDLREGLQAILESLNHFISTYPSQSDEIIVKFQDLETVLIARAPSRQIQYTWFQADEAAHGFQVRGGTEYCSGIFVADITSGSTAEQMGLLVGDQIMSVNGQSMESVPHSAFAATVKDNLELNLHVKHNVVGYYVVCQVQEHPALLDVVKSYRSQSSRGSVDSPLPATIATSKSSSNEFESKFESDSERVGYSPVPTDRPRRRRNSTGANDEPRRGRSNSMGADERRKRMGSTGSRGSLIRGSALSLKKMFRVRSTSESEQQIFRLQREFSNGSSTAESQAVIRVHRGDDPAITKLVAVARDSDASEVVMYLESVWNITRDNAPPSSIAQAVIDKSGQIEINHVDGKATDLSQLCGGNATLYLVPDSRVQPDTSVFAAEFEQQALHPEYFIACDARVIARALTLRDFELFRRVKPLEYLDFLWSKGGCKNQQAFADAFNQQVDWVVREVCRDHESVKKRAETIRKFIKIARLCQSVNNLNSQFAIISGLIAAPVSRLKATWERLPGKYTEQYAELEGLMDPSRNMAK